MTTPYSVCKSYLDYVGQSLADRSRAPIGRMLVNTGPVNTIDDCCPGQLTVGHDRIFRSITFPNEATGATAVEACWAGDIVVPLIVTLFRCIPTSSPQGRPPTVTAVAQATEDFMDDGAVMWNVLAAAVPVAGWQTAGLTLTPLTAEGGCVGHEFRLMVGVDQDGWCV